MIEWVGKKYTYDEFPTEREIAGIIVHLPKKPPKVKILNHLRQPRQKNFLNIQNEIKDALKEIHTWSQEKKNEWESREWDRRRNGIFFFNGKCLEYITGLHYFYLCYWQFNVLLYPFTEGKRLDLPMFIDSDRDRFLLWGEAVRDDTCIGLFEGTERRSGKSERSLCTAYEIASRVPESKCGMQSKTNEDAQTLFDRLIKGWQLMPYYFKPTHAGDSHPRKQLRFTEPGRRDTTGKKEYSKVLRSVIGFGPAKDVFYDGKEITFFYGDEIGKTEPKECNVRKRHYVVKECLMDGNVITGKMLNTTTVEEITREGLMLCKELWYDSDPEKKNSMGQTMSGMWKYFKPAYYGFRGLHEGKPFIDEFGYSDVKRAFEYLSERRKDMEHELLISEKRKYPFNEEEMFYVQSDYCPFDTVNINLQLEYNSTLPDHMVRQGNLAWSKRDEKVIFQDNANGKFKFVWTPKEEANKYIMKMGKRYPANTHKLCAGTDPFEHRQVSGGKKSNAATLGRYKFDPLNPQDSKFFFCLYLARPPKPEIYFEDMIMLCFFCGMELLCESNKIGLINYFHLRGYEKYLMKRPEPTHTEWSKKHQKSEGIPMSGEAPRNKLIDVIVTEICDNVGWMKDQQRYGMCYFDELLYDWLEFEVGNWTPYDLTVASGHALLAETKHVRIRSPRHTETDWIKKYKYKGTMATRVTN